MLAQILCSFTNHAHAPACMATSQTLPSIAHSTCPLYTVLPRSNPFHHNLHPSPAQPTSHLAHATHTPTSQHAWEARINTCTDTSVYMTLLHEQHTDTFTTNPPTGRQHNATHYFQRTPFSSTTYQPSRPCHQQPHMLTCQEQHA